MCINVTKCATLYSYYWPHVCTVITILADAQYPILLHLVARSTTYPLLRDDTDWRRRRLRGSQYRHWSRWLWMSAVLERIRWKSVAALFSKDPQRYRHLTMGPTSTQTRPWFTLSLYQMSWNLRNLQNHLDLLLHQKKKNCHVVRNGIPDLPNLFRVLSFACTFVYQWKCCWSWGRQLLYIWMLLSIVI